MPETQISIRNDGKEQQVRLTTLDNNRQFPDQVPTNGQWSHITTCSHVVSAAGNGDAQIPNTNAYICRILGQSPDRTVSWEVSESGVLRHRTAYSTVCTGINVLWRAFLGCLGIYMVVTGSVFINQCPLEPKIPVYLIVGGVFLLPVAVFALYMRNEREDRGLEGLWKLIGAIICTPLLLFHLTWSIAGLVWIYGNIPFVSIFDEVQPTYCHPVVYISGAVSIFVVLFMLCVLVYFSVLYFRRDVRRGVRRNERK